MIMQDIKPEDFPKVCRLCLSYENSINLLKSFKYISLIQTITEIKLQEQDVLPKNVCTNCSNKIEEIYNFVEMCNSNNKFLIKYQDEKLFLDNSLIAGKIITNKDNDYHSEEYNSDNDAKDSVKSERYSDPESDDDCAVEKRKKSCEYCFKEFKTKLKLKLHVEKICTKVNSTNSYICLICDWSGNSKPALRIHEKSEHTYTEVFGLNKKKWKCSQCNKLFTKKIDLQRHRRTHTGDRPFTCSRCDKSFTQKSTLERHIISLHREQKYNFECYICERKFVRKDHLEAHMYNVHIKRQSNESLELDTFLDLNSCRLCGKTFSIYSYLQNHLSVHEETKPLKPPKIRNCRFSTSSNLCSICGKSFEKRKTYQMHMNRKHLNKKYEPKPKCNSDLKKDHYQCWVCGKIFTTHSNLKVHIRIHTGEKPYECKFCSQRFAAYSSWHEHENIHTGAKPFQCDICKKGFRQRGSLRKHMKSSIHSKPAEKADGL